MTREWIEQVKGDLKGQFSAVPLHSTSGIPETLYTYLDDTPITLEEFTRALPKKIVDPRTQNEVKISQSLIKALRKMTLDKICPKRVYHTYITSEFEEEPGKAMKMGQRFEFELTGAPMRNGQDPEIVPGAEGKRITENAKFHQEETLSRIGIDLRKIDSGSLKVGPKLTFRCIEGTLDLYEKSPGKTWVDDIKYSGNFGLNTFGEPKKWMDLEFDWHEDAIRDSFSRKCQSFHYSLLAYLDGAKDVRFRFLVFGSTKGLEREYRVFVMPQCEKHLHMHMNLILYVAENLQELLQEGFEGIPQYKKGFCQDCPVKSCKMRKQYPDEVVVEL